jgi:glycosyltransferase involved in cell wall biosynthesis
MNIFIGAYACEPDRGSEPEVGWQMVNEIAKAMPDDDIHVITKGNNNTIIEAKKYPSNITFHYYSVPNWASFWKKGGRGARTYYYLWMIGATRHMKSLNLDFDIIHHVTFVNDWLPSFFVLLKNKRNKFIWGPIGSNDPISSKFLNGKKRLLIEKIPVVLKLFFRNVDPYFHFCKKKSDCIIGINENVSKKLNLNPEKKFIALPAIGMKKNIVEMFNRSVKNNTTFNVITVGRLLYIKNFELTILAFAAFLKKIPDVTDIRLQIIGDGQELNCLKELVKERGIEGNVDFIGKLPLDEVQVYLCQADVFLFPTLENAGFVILEAMGNALPVLAMNYGGPQQFIKHYIEEQLVSEKLPYEVIVDELASNLKKLYLDPSLRMQIGERNRVDILENFTWEAKALKMKEIYKGVLNEA